MMTCTERTHTVPVTRPLPTVAVVSRSPDLRALDAVLGAVNRVVFVDSMDNAYSRIRQLTPDVIVLCLSSDDPDGCQILSMLALDGATSHIPILTCTATSSDGVDDEASDPAGGFFSQFVPASLN